MPGTTSRADHWEAAYGGRGPANVSWYQAEPQVSLELVESLATPRDAAVLDVGGGASFLADRLLERGFADVTLLDLSSSALDAVRLRLGDAIVELLHEDLLSWQPPRTYDPWHDRAVFHFLVEEDDRLRYVEASHRPSWREALPSSGRSPRMPKTCSGLPVARYSPEVLARGLGERFELLHVCREEHRTPRGTVQPFTWVAGRMA